MRSKYFKNQDSVEQNNLIFSKYNYLLSYYFQIRFFLKSLCGNILPSQEEMIKEVSDHTSKKLVGDAKTKKIFVTNDDEDNEYFAILAAMADIEPMPPVMAPLYLKAKEMYYGNFLGFRNDVYEIIDPRHTFLHTIPKK